MDERLRFAERMAMQFHLAMCKNCARFNSQLQEMRRLFRVKTNVDETTPGLTPNARQRIKTELQKKLGS